MISSAFSGQQEERNEPGRLAWQEGIPFAADSRRSDSGQMAALIGVLGAFSLMFLSDLLKLKARKAAGNILF